MIEFLDDNKMRYIVIDFGHCFTGNAWTESLRNSRVNNNLMPIFWFVKSHIKVFDEFEV